MIRQVPVGIDDFRELREKNFEYVDKTHLITELLDLDATKVILVPRPRRFGKSMNLSMLKWFFEKRDESVWHLFEDLHVARAGDAYRQHFQKYPVVHINFKDTKAEDANAFMCTLRYTIRSVYKDHWPELKGRLDENDRREVQAILDEKADDVQYKASLAQLTKHLHRVHGVRPIVLIDEYDAALHVAYLNDFHPPVIDFFTAFFQAGLNDNPHLERAVMTGILRVSRESIFSELNNIGVYSLLRLEFNTCFGFTDDEVTGLLQRAELPEMIAPLHRFYNGYEFGGVKIYNTWAIVNFLVSVDKELLPYWVNTSSNGLIKELLQHHVFAMPVEIETLLSGGFVEKELDDNVVLTELKTDPAAFWNLLVFTGYLKAVPSGPVTLSAPPRYRLSIPNQQVAEVYRSSFQSWMNEALMTQHSVLTFLLKALLTGDALRFEVQLQKFALTLPSYHDVGGAEPETFYQGLMIGLLAALVPEYEVRSNRESGDGRPDVLIKPRQTGKPGVILELKSAREGESTLEHAMAEGLKQLDDHDYAADLRDAGVTKISQMVVAFDGKRVMVLPKGAPRPTVERPAKKKAAKKAATKKTSAKKATKKR